MRALVFDKTLSFDPRRPEPNPGDGDTLLRVRQAGICATDLEITKGYMGFRGVLGHEFVAEVISSPDQDLVGQRVTKIAESLDRVLARKRAAGGKPQASAATGKTRGLDGPSLSGTTDEVQARIDALFRDN